MPHSTLVPLVGLAFHDAPACHDKLLAAAGDAHCSTLGPILSVDLRPEPDNPEDRHAVRALWVHAGGHFFLGYIPRTLSATLAARLAEDATLKAGLVQNQAGVPAPRTSWPLLLQSQAPFNGADWPESIKTDARLGLHPAARPKSRRPITHTWI